MRRACPLHAHHSALACFACFAPVFDSAKHRESPGRRRRHPLANDPCESHNKRKPRAEEAPEIDLVMGFERYGMLPSTLRGLMGLEQLDGDEYAARSRVQARALCSPLARLDSPCCLRAFSQGRRLRG